MQQDITESPTLTYSGPKFVMVPEGLGDLVESGELHRDALAVYYTLRRMVNNRTKTAWPSNKTVAAKAGMSERQVQKMTQALRSVGYLLIEHRKDETGRANRSNVYRLLAEPWGGGAPHAPGGCTSCTRGGAPHAPRTYTDVEPRPKEQKSEPADAVRLADKFAHQFNQRNEGRSVQHPAPTKWATTIRLIVEKGGTETSKKGRDIKVDPLGSYGELERLLDTMDRHLPADHPGMQSPAGLRANLGWVKKQVNQAISNNKPTTGYDMKAAFELNNMLDAYREANQ